MIGCPYCSSNRVVNQVKKFKCLDCYKSFKYGKRISGNPTKEDVANIMSLMKRVAGFNITRDLDLDDYKFKESDRVKEV